MKTLILLFTLFVALVSVGLSEDARAIQQRMQQRLGAIDELKQKELVGENNKGFLAARGSLDPAGASVVSEENRDRAAVYVELAKRTGGSPDTVGQVRARKIAESSAKGIWLEDESGRWYKK